MKEISRLVEKLYHEEKYDEDSWCLVRSDDGRGAEHEAKVLWVLLHPNTKVK